MVGGVAAEGDAPIGGAPDGPPVAGWLPSVGTAPLAAMVMWAAPDVSVGTPSSVGGTVCAYPGLGRGAINIDPYLPSQKNCAKASFDGRTDAPRVGP